MKPAVHKYADGGKVVVDKPKMKPHVPAKVEDPIAKSKHKLKRVKKADGGKVVSKKGRKKPKPEMLGSGTASKAARAVSGRQRQIDKALADAGA